MHLTETARLNAIRHLLAFQSEESGLVDFTGDRGMRSSAGIRELVSYCLPQIMRTIMSYEDCTDDLNRVCADLARCSRRYRQSVLSNDRR